MKSSAIAMILRVVRKDFAIGPRSPFFAFAVAIPVGLTLITQLVFGNLFDPKPRVGIVDAGDSRVAVGLTEQPGFRVTALDDAQLLRELVESHDLDAGVVLPAGFDADVQAGRRPALEFVISGQSLAFDRLLVSVTTIDLIRAVEGRAAPVDVQIVDLGGRDALPLSTRLIPVMVMYAFIMAGVFVPASSIVEERERGTLTALLISPLRIGEFVVAKLILGVVMSFAMALVTLALNSALAVGAVAMLTTLAVTSVFWSLIGVIVGLVSPNSQVLFGLIKGAGIVLFGPVIFYLFPDWPQWIARLFPTFWAIDPIWRIVSDGAALVDVAGALAVTAGIGVAMAIIVTLLGRRVTE